MTHRQIRDLGAVVIAVLCLAGCGNEGERRAAPRPALPRSVAVALAGRSDAVAQALDAGDSCRALAIAEDLRQRTIAAINAHRVPRPLQEPLQGSVNDLVARIPACSPPQNEDEDGPGKGKKKGKKHGKGHD